MKTLYVSDLDGTLLNSNSKISCKTVEIINALIAQGMSFTLATARSRYSANQIIEGLQLRLPLIVYNGAAIMDPVQGECVYKCVFDQTNCEQLLRMLLKQDIYPFVYAWIDGVERVSYMEEYLHKGGWHYLSKRQHDPRFRKVKNACDLFEGSIFYLTCIDDKDMLEPVYQQLPTTSYTVLFQQELYRNEYWLEIMPAGVSKAIAIQTLQQTMCFDRIISFGDAINDKAMFEISDECYAVENAVEALKDIASGVVHSNDEDGVARWLLEHVGKEKR